MTGRSVYSTGLMVLAGSLVGALASASAAAQAPFPSFDIKQSCQAAGAGCLAAEEGARARLQAMWGQLSPAKQAACAARGAAIPGGSYLAALSCARGG